MSSQQQCTLTQSDCVEAIKKLAIASDELASNFDLLEWMHRETFQLVTFHARAKLNGFDVNIFTQVFSDHTRVCLIFALTAGFA